MELEAKKRPELGRKSKKLLKDGSLPAVVFGKGVPSEPVTLKYNQFEKVFEGAGESTLVDLTISGEPKVKVLISEVARHPITGRLVHANLHKVNLKEKITATVPLEVAGESPAVRSGEGMLLKLIDEVMVEALPQDLPHDIKVDISGLVQIEQGIRVGELPIDHSKVKILHHEPDELVVKIDYAEMKQEEVSAVEVPVSEAELVAKVEATEQLTEEEKAKRAEAEKAKKEKKEKE